MDSLEQMLEDYRNGERGLPSYEELVVFASQPLPFKEVGSFLYVGWEYVATSSDDPRGIKLYRPIPIKEPSC